MSPAARRTATAPQVRDTPQDARAARRRKRAGAARPAGPQPDARRPPVPVRRRHVDPTQQQQSRHDPRQHREADQEAAGEPAQGQRFMVEERPQARQGRREGRIRVAAAAEPRAARRRLNRRKATARKATRAQDDRPQDHRPQAGGTARRKTTARKPTARKPRRRARPRRASRQPAARSTARGATARRSHGTPHDGAPRDHRALSVVRPSPGGMLPAPPALSGRRGRWRMLLTPRRRT